jgi:hypothetical protein
MIALKKVGGGNAPK